MVFLYLFAWGFIVGVYCNKFNYHQGAISKGDISAVISVGLYPHSKVFWLIEWHGWCASLVNPNGKRQMIELIRYTYLVD